MTASDRPSRTRCALVALAGWGLAAALVWVAGPWSAAGPSGGGADWLVRLCSLAVTGSASWLAVVTTAVVTDALRQRPAVAVRTCPPGLQRWLLEACGVAVVVGLAGPATAADDGRAHGPVVGLHRLQGLPLPDRPVAVTGAASGRDGRAVDAETPPGRTDAVVTVRPGDCLWTIAAATLPAGAADAEIATRWQRIWALNRSVVGTDPDLIRAGQRLRLPRS
ncbi:MAG: LysM domain-containing protein [Nocardioidaceae bacterium]